VSHDQLQSSVQRALTQLPLRDLSVEDPPLEEVMRELFARGAKTEERALPATGGAHRAEQTDGAA
jgi:hypothetical protein